MNLRFGTRTPTRWFSPCPACKRLSETEYCAGDRLLFCADCTEWFIL